jgi:hypothetical protein
VITASYHCSHCNRPLKRFSIDGLGPTCRRNLTGAKTKRARKVVVADPRQVDWVAQEVAS